MRMRLGTGTNGDPELCVSFLDAKDADDFFDELEMYGKHFGDPEYLAAVGLLLQRTIENRKMGEEMMGSLYGKEAMPLLEGLSEAILSSNILFDAIQNLKQG